MALLYFSIKLQSAAIVSSFFFCALLVLKSRRLSFTDVHVVVYTFSSTVPLFGLRIIIFIPPVNLFWSRERAHAGSETACQMQGKSGAAGRGHKCKERDPFCCAVRNACSHIHAYIHTFILHRIYIRGFDERERRGLLVHSFGRCGLSRTTANGTPQSSRYECIASPHRCSEGTLRRGVSDRKKLILSHCKERRKQKAMTRPGATRRTAQRTAVRS